MDILLEKKLAYIPCNIIYGTFFTPCKFLPLKLFGLLTPREFQLRERDVYNIYFLDWYLFVRGKNLNTASLLGVRFVCGVVEYSKRTDNIFISLQFFLADCKNVKDFASLHSSEIRSPKGDDSCENK